MQCWLLLASPNKWFYEGSEENAKVNDELFNLDDKDWKVRETFFKNAKIGDKCIVKVGNDSRTIKNRTLTDGYVVPKLEAGIYAIGEISEELYYDEKTYCHRVVFKCTQNLFAEGKIIDKSNAKIILKNDYSSRGSKGLDVSKYNDILSYIKSNF